MKKDILKRGTALLLAAALGLSGCGTKTENGDSAGAAVQNTDNDGETGDPNVNPKGVLPIVKEPITLQVAIRANPQVEDFKNNEFTAWVEEQTNIKLEFILLPDKDTDTKINLMFAAGKDLPDVITTTQIKNDSLYKFALDGLVIPLDHYIEEYGVEYPNLLKDCPDIEKAMTAPDGHTYGLPKYNVTLHNQMREGKMYLYKPWVEKLGMEMPKTVDEFYEVLKAIKTQDPNGNGQADEIPMAGATSGAQTDVLAALMAPFIPYTSIAAGGDGLLNDNGTIIASYTQPEFKQGMEWIAKLVKEGLVDPVSFTQDQQQLKQLANRTETILGGYVHAYTAINATDSKMLDYECLPLLEGGTERGGFLNNPLLPAGASWVVTSSCQYPEAAYRLGDFLLSEESGMRNRYGVEDRDWKYVDEKTTDLVGLDGKPARFEILDNQWSKTGSVFWRSECIYYNNYENVYGKGFQKDVFNPDKYHHDNTVTYYQPYVVGDIVPAGSLFFTEEELSDYASLASGIKEFVKQQLAAFATGSRSMDEWDAFQQEIKDLGFDQYMEYIQTAYDRQFSK